MKRTVVLSCVLMVASFALAQAPADVAQQKRVELRGVPGNVDFAPGKVLVDTYSGELTTSSPTWDRIYGCTVSPTCAATCFDSSVNGQYYEVIPIQVDAVENLECAVTASAITDTVMTLYCDPFNPATPLVNAVAYDDDDGAGNWSAFLATDAITLQPGQTYFVVLSTFSSGITGTFTISFTSATVHVVPVELQSLTAE